MLRKQNFVLVGTIICAASPTTAIAESKHEHSTIVEEIIVTAPFQRSVAETTLPITVLSGEELRESGAASLGETLQDSVGLANASFGTGVGQPIIRGQTGGRVQVLQNGIGVTDASNISPDHANGVDALLAERLEIIRGPATLLYGSGAVGGVVNVIDNRIPEAPVSEPQFMIDHRHDSVSDGNTTTLKLDLGNDRFAFHLEGLVSTTRDFDIPGGTIDFAGLEAREALHGHEDEHHDDDDEHHDEDEEHHDDDEDEHGHEEEEDELTSTRGFIGNSDRESDSFSVGFSTFFDSGFIGVSATRSTSDYGLPPGVHSHGDEDDDEQHDDEDEHHDDEDDHEGEEEHEDEDEHGHEEEVEFVRVDMEKTRYEIKGGYDFTSGPLTSIRGSVALTDYEHSEIEIFEDGMAEVGTRFSNEGTDGRLSAAAELGDWSTVFGVQFSDTEFSAVGEEAYIPKSDITHTGIFAVAERTDGKFTTELGIRSERSDIELRGSSCDASTTSFSASGSVLYAWNSETNLMLGLARSERAPGVEELFSNVSGGTCASVDEDDRVFHAATNLIELGNPNLDTEVSTNIELGIRKHSGRITAGLSIFYNEVDDYIGLQFVPGDEEDEIAGYIANDAIFSGFEAEMDILLLERDDTDLSISFFADQVHARFDGGEDLPRITPPKVGFAINYSGQQWSTHLRYTRVDEQDRTGPLEVETDGYSRVSFYADRHWTVGNSNLTTFVKASNLLDKEIRNHASLLKHFAPEPGRNIQFGIRFNY